MSTRTGVGAWFPGSSWTTGRRPQGRVIASVVPVINILVSPAGTYCIFTSATRSMHIAAMILFSSTEQEHACEDTELAFDAMNAVCKGSATVAPGEVPRARLANRNLAFVDVPRARAWTLRHGRSRLQWWAHGQGFAFAETLAMRTLHRKEEYKRGL